MKSRNWRPAKRLTFHDGRSCEVGTTLYRAPEGREVLRVVMLRALKPDEPGRALFGDTRYDFHAFVTNIGEHEIPNEKLVDFYRGRADVENCIKELKGGFDLRHFPCLSLLANKAYGLMAAFAMNLVRFVAWLENPRRPHFAKLLRFKVLTLPVQVVRHARTISFRFMARHREEVERLKTTLHIKFGLADASQAQTALFDNSH